MLSLDGDHMYKKVEKLAIASLPFYINLRIKFRSKLLSKCVRTMQEFSSQVSREVQDLEVKVKKFI